jgi:hypothetical protein
MDIAWSRGARAPRAWDAVLAFGLVVMFAEPGFDPYHHVSGSLWATAGVLGTAALAWGAGSGRGLSG